MPSLSSRIKRRHYVAGIAVVGTICVIAWNLYSGRPAAGETTPEHETQVREGVVVEYVLPQAGGIDRICTQPGTIEPFESADLYAKVAGYLIEQKVDIGAKVKEGDVLAKIAVPDYEMQVKQDAADVVRAQAKIDQMKAAIAAAEADVGAAHAAVALTEAEKKSKTSFRTYREKQRDRIQGLVAQNAIDAKLADEQEDQYQAAHSAELAAIESVGAAKQKEVAAKARVKQAEADLRHAEAEVATAEARLEKSRVMVDYSIIRSPYTGVVTRRSFHRGDFIRSADAGGDRMPLFSVERRDLMRVIIQIPERDTPFVTVGDPATVEVDAWSGEVFKTTGENKVVVSRMADSEDTQTRMMRTEVDIQNPDAKLRRGMYGRVTLALQVGSPGALRIPSAALSGKADGTKAQVRVVRDNKAHLVTVRYGVDNGSEVEVLAGLTPSDRVIVRASGPLVEGTIVAASEAKTVKGGH